MGKVNWLIPNSMASIRTIFADRRGPAQRGLPTLASVLALSLLFVAIPVAPAFAKPTLKSFSPAYAKINASTELTAQGSFPVWPVTVWSNSDQITATAGDKGKLTLKVSSQAAPGVYFLRLLDPSGVSEPVPIVVGIADGVVEKEPNNRLDKPQSIELPCAVSGVLQKRGDVDCFAVQLEKGDTVVASMIANPALGNAIDGVLQISDQRGFVLNQNDDNKGTDPQLVVPISKDGTYLIRVFAFPAAPNSTIGFAGGADYRYVLRITKGPFVDFPIPLGTAPQKLHGWNLGDQLKPQVAIGPHHATVYSDSAIGSFRFEPTSADTEILIEKRPEGSADAFQVIKVPSVLSGQISEPREFDVFQFTAKKGARLRFTVESRKFGFELDPAITIFDAKAKQLVHKDDRSKTDLDVHADLKAPADGEYFVRVKDASELGGPRFPYRLIVEEVKPSYSISVAASNYQLEKGKELSVEVTINRLDGFADPIEISAAGLPKEIQFQPVTSQPKGETAKKVKLTLRTESDSGLQSEFKILGKSKSTAENGRFKMVSGEFLESLFITKVASKKADSKKAASK